MENNNPLKLLVLCQLFYPELISTGQTLTELCEKLVEMGIDIEVICGYPTLIDIKSEIPSYLEYRGIKIRRVRGTRFPKLNLIGRIINQCTYAFSVFLYLIKDKEKRPILILTNPPFLAFICAFLRIFRKIPYIYLIFDVYPDTAINLGVIRKRGLITFAWNLINTVIIKYASSIIVIGRCMKQLISEKVSSANADKVQFIHLWSDDKNIEHISKDKNPLVKKWGLEGKFVLGYFGNMGRFHDIETIMQAAKVIHKENSDIIFLFVGEGYKKELAIKYANKWGLSNCQFHHYVSREELKYSLSSADVGLVCLLKGQEGLSVPSKTFGLMAANIPIIAVMPGKSEIALIIKEENCGLVTKPGDVMTLVEAIYSLYRNPQKLKSMSENARKAIDLKYNLNLAAQKYYDIIRKVSAAR